MDFNNVIFPKQKIAACFVSASQRCNLPGKKQLWIKIHFKISFDKNKSKIECS